eukprot:scaffold572_cov163-Ochromonas_danica.AAC.6
MKAFLLILLVSFAVMTAGFRFTPLRRPLMQQSFTSLSMSDEEAPKVDLVPLDRSNVESAATVTGGVLGLILGGPVGALILAAVTNYVAKKENDSGEAIRGFGKTALESFNFLTKINQKYNIADKVGETVTKTVDSVVPENEALEKVKETYSATVTKIDELNKEYDLVSKSKEVLSAAATLSDAAIEKAVEINQKYDLVGSAVKIVGQVVEKTSEVVKEKLNERKY